MISSKKSLLLKLVILEKEIEILICQKKKRLNLKISDREPEFFLDYNKYGIKEVCTSVKAPNMNSILDVIDKFKIL